MSDLDRLFITLRKLRRSLGRFPSLDEKIRVLRRTKEIEALQGAVEELRRELAQWTMGRSPAQPIDISDSVRRYVTYFPPGHFYSPVPDFADIDRQAERIFAPRTSLSGIAIKDRSQVETFASLSSFGREADLFSQSRQGGRYLPDNPNYGIGDALILHSMLRKLRPQHYLEVGSGWSTALAMDTNQFWLGNSMSVTAIEPHPELLRELLNDDDAIEIIDRPVQEIDPQVFAALAPNDVLFIDCSHVVKTGSDAHFLITRVLPEIRAGVYVHFHDVFWPFEYPRVWIEEGRAWNEDYLLHAFLLFNDSFEIVFFNNWFAQAHRSEVEQLLPEMLENPGGALWLVRR